MWQQAQQRCHNPADTASASLPARFSTQKSQSMSEGMMELSPTVDHRNYAPCLADAARGQRTVDHTLGRLQPGIRVDRKVIQRGRYLPSGRCASFGGSSSGVCSFQGSCDHAENCVNPKKP
jgi:hypothetical protein